MEELLEEVLSVGSVPSVYNADQLPLILHLKVPIAYTNMTVKCCEQKVQGSVWTVVSTKKI
jgi:hypothetical protein